MAKVPPMTGYEMLAREKKARAYANHLRAHKITADEIELYAQQEPEGCERMWQQFAKILKLNPPSEKTRKLVMDMLREAE